MHSAFCVAHGKARSYTNGRVHEWPRCSARFAQVRLGKRDLDLAVDYMDGKHHHTVMTFRCDDLNQRNEWLEELHKAVQRRIMAGTFSLAFAASTGHRCAACAPAVHGKGGWQEGLPLDCTHVRMYACNHAPQARRDAR